MTQNQESFRKMTELQARESVKQTPLMAKNPMNQGFDNPMTIRYRSYCRSLAAAMLIALSGIFVGFCMSQMSPITPQTYIDNWNLSFSQQWCQIMMIGLPAVAAVIGAFFSKITIAKLTRKMNLVLSCILVIIGSFIMLVPYEEALIIGRIVQGFGLGIQIAIATVYLRQSAPKQLRSYFMPMMSIGITLGSLILYFISEMMVVANLNPDKQAKVLVTFSVVFAVAQIIGCFTVIPNSPYQLVSKGDLQGAKNQVRIMYLDEYVQEEFETIVKQLQLAKKARQAAANKGQRSEEDSQLVRKANKARGVAIVISVYRQLNGANLSLTFAGPILNAVDVQSGINIGLTTFGPLIIMLVSFIGNVIGIVVLANKFGRKPLMIVASITMGATMIAAGVACQLASPWALFILLIVNMFCYGAFSLAPGWTYPNQVVPADKVALQNALQSFALTIAVWVNPIAFNYTAHNNIFFMFYAYGAINLICLFVYIFVMVESRNRTYLQIIKLY